MADQDKHDKSVDEKTDMETTVNGAMIKEIFESLDIAIDRNNTSIKDLSTLTSTVAVNTAKKGITSSQESAITANTAKTGITTAQASAITANTAKTGISTTQATQIDNLVAGRATGVYTNVNKVTAQITNSVTVNAKTGAATLDTSVRLSNGAIYTLSQALTKAKK